MENESLTIEGRNAVLEAFRDPLVFPGFRHLVKPLLRNKRKDGIPLFRLPHNRADGSVLTAIQHKNFIDGLSRAERLKHRISSLFLPRQKTPPSRSTA